MSAPFLLLWLLSVATINWNHVYGRSIGRQAGGELTFGLQGPSEKGGNPGLTPIMRKKLGSIATVPTRVVTSIELGDRKRYAMVPAEEESKLSLANILDAREHWWISRYLQAMQRIPPVTALYLVSSTVTALLAWAANDNYPFDFLQFNLSSIKKGHLWKLVTPYLYFGQLWLSHLFMAQSVALYMSSVEISHCARPEKFVEFLLFGMTFISTYGLAESLSGRGDMTMMSAAYHLHTYMLYYWSRINEGSMVNCFDLFMLPAETVPMLFMLQNYLLYREFYVSDIAAIGAAYAYFHFLGDAPAVWPLSLLKSGAFRDLYQRYNNEIAR